MMPSFLSTAKKDLEGLTRSWRNMLLVLLAPPLAIMLAAQGDSTAPVRLLVAGGQGEPGLDRLVVVLQQSSALAISREPKLVADPLSRLRRDGFELLLNYGEAGKRDLSIYTAQTDPLRLQRLEQIASGIGRAYAFIRFRSAESSHSKPLMPDVRWAQIPIYEELFFFGSFPVNPLFEYFPQAVEPRFRLLPAAISLVLGLVPFALGVAAAAEAGARVGSRSWMECAKVVLGKALVPCLIAAMNFVLMLLVVESFGGFYVKAGVFRFLLMLLPSLLACAFLGLCLAWLARSPLELTGVCLSYGLVLVLASDFAALGTEALWFTRAVAELLPSTFVRPALASWMFGVRPNGAMAWLGGRLALHALFFGVLAVTTLWWKSRGALHAGPVEGLPRQRQGNEVAAGMPAGQM